MTDHAIIQRLAAPAPSTTDDEDAATRPPRDDPYLDELCERFAHWSITRRFYGGPRPPKSLLGTLAKRTRPMRLPPDAACSSLHAAMHLALLGQSPHSLGRRVFELHYLHRVPSIKQAAQALGIGRAHWYRVLREFRHHLYSAAVAIQADRTRAFEAAPSSHQRDAAPRDTSAAC